MSRASSLARGKAPALGPDDVHDWRREVFLPLLDQHARIAVCGGPRTGKSTLVSLVTDRHVEGTDDYIGMAWEDVPQSLIEKLSGVERFVVEGVMVPRALRRGLQVDCVVWLETFQTATLPGHVSMLKGIRTVFAEWRRNNRCKVVVLR